MVKMTIIKAVNVNQFRLFIVIIKNALQVSEIVIFIKPAHGRTGPPGFSHAARRPSPPLHVTGLKNNLPVFLNIRFQVRKLRERTRFVSQQSVLLAKQQHTYDIDQGRIQDLLKGGPW